VTSTALYRGGVSPRSVAAAAGCALAIAACTLDARVATVRTSSDGGADAEAGHADDRATYCLGQGPPILVGDSAGATTVCSGRLAAKAFRYALCTCDSLSTSDMLVTDSFSSAQGPYAPGGVSGAVGTNGAITVNGRMQVGGSLWVGGAAGVSVSNLAVATDLHDEGILGGMDTISIGHDAFVDGDVTSVNLSVGGTLTLPAAATLSVTGTNQIAATARAPVSVAPPCACDAADVVDIAGYVAAQRAFNHDADIGLDPASLATVTADRQLTLPCGRFYLTGVGGQGTASLTITAAGRTALFVDGDVSLRGGLAVELADGGELDLFVGGMLIVDGPLRLGAPTAPSRLRVYVGSSLQLGQPGVIGGNLYAPTGVLAVGGGVDAYGSVFVKHLQTAGVFSVHYDTDVLQAAARCPSTDGGATSCQTCDDCGDQACVAGVCGACATNADCCAPLTCAVGACVANAP
jgi:cytoskeletal protein CcmA (bactofilin family)